MKIRGVMIEHEPGQTYDEDEEYQETPEERAHRRAEGRQAAINAFRTASQQEIKGQLHATIDVVIAMAISLRAMHGNTHGTGIGSKLREAADFLEDFDA
jgi:hypothetical protein